MNFLQLVSENLCHGPNNIVLCEGPGLLCTVCNQKPIQNIYEYISHPPSGKDSFFSSTLAEAYYDWTGDNDVPVTFIILDIKGILDTRVEKQKLGILKESVYLLKALNAPFVENYSNLLPVDTKYLNDFRLKYLSTLVNPNIEHGLSEEEKCIIEYLLSNFHLAASENSEYPNPLEYYFEIIVPYVLACKGNFKKFQIPDEESNVAKQLLMQFKISERIREEFSQFSLCFDIPHVMVCVHACSTDLKVALNWILDFVSKVCVGKFFWKNYSLPCEFAIAIKRICEIDISYKNRTDFHYLLREIRNGNGTECLSTSFQTYVQLTKFVFGKFKHIFPKQNEKILETAFYQLFPEVLFENVADQMGFTFALSTVVSNLDPNTNTVPKGIHAKARQIDRIIKPLIKRVQNFNSIPLCWTIDTFNMFTAHDPEITKDIERAAKFVFDDNNNKK